MPDMLQLDALFKSLHDAVVQASEVARDSNIDELKTDFFEPETVAEGDAAGRAPGEYYRPKMVNLLLPSFENGKKTERPYAVPLYALAKQQSLCLDELKIQLNVELHGLDGQNTVASPTGPRERGSTAVVEMKFKAAAPPEGVMRINDHLVKALP